jgi:putative tricarboxylic transport membrane protein
MVRDQRLAVGLGLFAVIYMVGAWRLPRFALGSSVIDAHIFPLVMGGILLLLSAIFYLQSQGSKPKGPLLEGVEKRLLVKLVGATFLYALVLGTLGYLIATSLFLITTMRLMDYKKWSGAAAIGVGFAAGTYLLFAYVLGVPLARGILPF